MQPNTTLEKLREFTRYDVETLPNGTNLITQYRQGLSVAVSIKFGYGMAHDAPEKRQASHFAEHLMLKKGPRKVYRARLEELDYLSANGWNASTHMEHINLGNGGVFETLPRNAERLVRTLGDMINDDRIEEEHFESERQILITEMKPFETSEYHAFTRKCFSLFWGSDHPYSLASDPGLDSLRRLSIDDINHVFRSMQGSNAVISVVGEYDEPTLQAAREAFGRNTSSGFRNSISTPNHPMTQTVECRMKDAGDPYIRMSFQLPGERHDDTAQMRTLLRYLNHSSKLMRRLRDEQGLCYAVNALYDENSAGSESAIVVARFEEPDKERIVREVAAELDEVKEGSIDTHILEQIKERTENAAMSYERRDISADNFSNAVLFELPNPYDSVRSVLDVTKDGIQRLAQTYFNNPIIAIGLKS